jgi:type IV pilus assembly protein PilM
MSEFHQIRIVDSVALQETAPLETGWADHEPERLAEVIQLPRRHRLFGFARAVEAVEEIVEAPARRGFRTEISFRRIWPGERDAQAVAVEIAPGAPAWRTELVFRRAQPVASVAQSSLSFETLEPGVVATTGSAGADVSFRRLGEHHAVETETEIETEAEAEIAIPEPSIAVVLPVVAADDESAPETDFSEAAPEHEFAGEPTVVVPDPDPDAELFAPVAVEEKSPSRFGRKPRAPKAKKAGRGGGSPKGNRLVGLKVGASQLAAAVVVNDGAPEVTQLARTPFEPGVVVDGEVRDEDALAAALKSFFAGAGLPTRGVRVGLSSNRIGVRTLDIVGIDDAERFDNAVRFKAHEVLPIAMNESVLDYRVLGERLNESGEPTKRVLLVVAPRDQVDPYVNACRKAGIRLSGIDLEAFALLRSFVEPRTNATEQAAIVVVAIGHESTTLVVSGAGVCEFTRVFGWGGSQLDAAIAAACNIGQLEASAIKTQLSLSGALPAGVDAGLAGKALEAVRTELTLFARELVSSLQFYQKQPDSLGIGEVVVTGGTSQLGGLADSLHTLVGVPVRLGDPLARVVAGRGLASDPTIADTLGSLAVPIGLGIDDAAVRAVNLLPADAQTSTRKRPSRTQLLVPAALIVPVVAVGALLLPAKSSVSDKESQLQALEAELATLPQPQGPGIDQSIKGDQARRAAVVADVLSKRLAWDRVLRDLALVLPNDVWLTEMAGAVPTPLSVAPLAAAVAPTPAANAAAAAPTGLRITGRTYTQAGVAKLLARLATVPTLTSVQLTNSRQAEVAERTVIEFEIAANVRGAGEAS